jgi:hypothetical protein
MSRWPNLAAASVMGASTCRHIGERHRRFWLLLAIALLACLPGTALALRLQHGDLLFVSAGTTGLSGAINDATARQGNTSFDHVALLDARTPAGGSVLHADEKGSRQQGLAEFLEEAATRQRQVQVYRLRERSPDVIDTAIAQARSMLGKPYNRAYVQDDGSYYCSDFIERAFRAHRIFELQPMNFRNPQTGQIAAYWVDFYRGLGMDVPQDLPGTNPNDMAHAAVLEHVGPLTLQD